MGRWVQQPRLVAYMADGNDLEYTYSGITPKVQPWTNIVHELCAEVERETGVHFNSCLLNYYRNGDDYVSWHADNEKLYGNNSTIASVSFGASREFVLRCREDPKRILSYSLGDGDLLVMAGTTQKHWLHTVPKRKRVQEPRVSLTFRAVMTGAVGG